MGTYTHTCTHTPTHTHTPLHTYTHPSPLAHPPTHTHNPRAHIQAHPFGVDVSSGTETDGAKDPKKLEAFVKNAKGW